MIIGLQCRKLTSNQTKNIKKRVLTLPPPFMKKCVVIVAHFPSPFKFINSGLVVSHLHCPLGALAKEANVFKDLF